MPVDTQQILDAAEKLGKLVAQHPAVERFRQAQKSLSDDPEAARLAEAFNRQLMSLARQEESGVPVTDAQRHQLAGLQSQLASHLKFKAYSVAQVEYVDLMRRISDTIRRCVSEAPQSGSQSPQPAAPRAGD